MRLSPLLKVTAFAALLHALPSLAVSCEELRAEVESKIRATGVALFTVSVVEASASTPGKIVGICDRGNKKLIYTQGNSAAGTKAPTTAGPAPVRPARKAEPILTECRDGTASMNTDCKK
jgi:hypothetical protein